MKSLGFKLVYFLLISLSLVVCACTPRDWFLVNSSGIARYNRHTGEFEILWEQTSPKVIFVRDTVREDSVTIHTQSK